MTRAECLKRLHMLQMTKEAIGAAENVQALQMAIEVLERIREAREAAKKSQRGNMNHSSPDCTAHELGDGPRGVPEGTLPV